MNSRHYSLIDKILIEIDQGLATIFGQPLANRPNPAEGCSTGKLSSQETTKSAGFMRVNHSGEVCAQALYRGQMLISRSPATTDLLHQACQEEKDHLAWTQQRLAELQTHRSFLNLYWYMLSFFIGIGAGLCGDRWSLGFVEETEQQVSQHLTHHINDLPLADERSRKIVEQMRKDEERHGHNAAAAGSQPLPLPIRKLMRLQSKVLTTLAYYV